MFWNSLQLKLILIFFILIATTIIGIGVFSINTTEEVYFNGFVEEMLNTIASFGINMENMRDDEKNYKNELFVGQDFLNKKYNVKIDEVQIAKKREEKLLQETFLKIYDNFNIYFSLNNISRRRIIIR